MCQVFGVESSRSNGEPADYFAATRRGSTTFFIKFNVSGNNMAWSTSHPPLQKKAG